MDFNKIIENNRQNVRSIIRMITKETNEDLEQEVYIKAWQNTDKYEEQGKFKSWINTIAKNLSKDYVKSAKVRYETKTENDDLIFNSLKDKKMTPEFSLIVKDRQIKTLNAINSLKPKFKTVIVLSEINGMTYEEIAKKLKCPVGTVKSRIYNAKKELYEKLKDVV